MSSKDPSNLKFTSNDEELALKAIQTSTELLRQTEVAKRHIERAFRVQIEQNAGRTPVSDEDALALEIILMRLSSLRTTIEVDSFYPRMFFQQRFVVEHTVEMENASAFPILKKYIEKYTPGIEGLQERNSSSSSSTLEPPVLSTPPLKSWCDETLEEIERFANFDAVDFGRYLRTKFPQMEETTSEEGSPWDDAGWSSESLPAKGKGKGGNGKAENGAPSPNGTVTGKSKNKSLFKNGLFGLKRKDSTRSGKELVAQSKAILDRCERLGK